MKLYIVYDENDSIYLAKANNKKEAIDNVYSQFGYGERKSKYSAKELEKEFHDKGFDRTVVLLSC
jgi:hypothetical protein